MSETSPKPNLTDVVIALGTTVGLLLLTQIAREAGSSPPDLVAYLLSGLVGLILLWRRRFPTGVAAVSMLLVYTYHILGYPALGNLPLAAALMSASYFSATGSAVIIGSLSITGTLIWFLVGESRDLAESLNFVISEIGVLAAVILTGWVLRSRKELAEESEERLRLAKADQEARSARRIAEERLKIARDIHDVVAHTVAVIGVQAKVAAETLDDSPGEAEKALQIINEATRDATAELRATVGVLRSQSLHPAPRLNQVRELVDSVASGDLAVELEFRGESRQLGDLVELVAYRVVQEALTNVVRHASATKARVEIEYGDAELIVTVSDDGVGGAPAEGYGITGMRERVEAIGGNLSIGAADLGGLCVLTRLSTGDRR
jgi:signal transduction histidine kinase